MRDVETLRALSRVLLILTAICVTLFPVLYAVFSPWYRSKLGIAVMLQSVAIALTIDYSAGNRYVFPEAEMHVRLLVYIVLLSLVCLTSLFLTAVLLYINFHPNKGNQNVRHNRDS
jgi:hypothetical protein